MSDLIYIEPAYENRQGFARWCLAQDPPVQTASHSGVLVPAALFAEVPLELLDGARVDGHVFRPVIEGLVPHGDGYRPAGVPVDDGVKPEPLAEPAKASRKRTAVRKVD